MKLRNTNRSIRLSRTVLIVFVSIIFNFGFSVFNPAAAQRPSGKKGPTVLSVADILPNYGLDTAMVNDTTAAVAYIEAQPENYVELTNLCVAIRTKAQQAIASIENDHEFRDSLYWIDSNTALGDYTIYEFRLRRLADLMGRMSIKYSRLEQQRVEAEKEAARLRAIEEARRQQEARDREADDLKGSIERHHRTIITACDGAGVTDKVKLKSLKDLYYSYLMVYNKYDLTSTHATPESNAQLDELNSFQNNLIENVLGENSLPSQIEGFKARLKARCEKDNSDIYRSYSRVFKQTSVPISFADVREYDDYLNRMNTVINVQGRYLQTIDLRATIDSGSNAIINLYGKKYRDVVSSYKEVVRSLDIVPAFTTNAESLNFIQRLEDFIAAQQIYLSDYAVLEEITRRSDSIMNGRAGSFRDVISAYRDIQSSLVPAPSFRDEAGARRYEGQLNEVQRVQECYMRVFDLRRDIERNDDSLNAARKVDRTLTNGYRLLRKQSDITPNFSTIERGNSFINILNGHIEMQNLCLNTVRKLRIIERNEERITSKDIPFRNIQKAYSRMLKAYSNVDEITNQEDLRRYSRQCDYILEMQEAFLKTIAGELATDSDNKLRRESDVEKIKLVIGL